MSGDKIENSKSGTKNPKMENSDLVAYIDNGFNEFRARFREQNITNLAYIKFRMKFTESEAFAVELLKVIASKKLVSTSKDLEVLYRALVEFILSIDSFVLPDTKQIGHSTRLNKNPIAKSLKTSKVALGRILDFISNLSDPNDLAMVDGRIPTEFVSKLIDIQQRISGLELDFKNAYEWDQSWSHRRAVDQMIKLGISPSAISKIIQLVYKRLQIKKRREFQSVGRHPDEINLMRAEKRKQLKKNRKNAGVSFYFRIQLKTVLEYLSKKTEYFKPRGRKKKIRN